MRESGIWLFFSLLVMGQPEFGRSEEVPRFDQDIVPLIKRHCVKCHGPAKQEGKLDLSVAVGFVRGGKHGSAIVPHDLDASLIWKRVEGDEMPPDESLSAGEKALLKRWIIAGTPGLPEKGATDSADHWAFRRLAQVPVPEVRDTSRIQGPLDRFLQSRLEAQDLGLAPEADRFTLIRRVSLDLTGLPPTIEQISNFVSDVALDAYPRMVERFLAAPQYGERLGKVWLDAAGYADSNGYFSADSDRPLAYRYRDWVVRALNRDVPYDQFVRDQIAGDEISAFHPETGPDAPDQIIERLEATHYLRNGQDGSGESDGNPDEVRVDRYTALESSMQNLSASLLGLTIQCAKCHDHKFEPITQRDYYHFQAVLSGVFAPDQWLKPNERFVYASRPGEFEAWQSRTKELDIQIKKSAQELAAWTSQHRPRGQVLLEQTFDGAPEKLLEQWSNTAPGDDTPGGTVPVQLNQPTAPACLTQDGHLKIVEGGTSGNSWISTIKSFDWTPNEKNGVIQATFELVNDRLTPQGTAADRIGYYIGLHDFNDNSPTKGGNILIDGNPAGSSAVHLDYPGDDNKHIGAIGTTGYSPGHTYGVRITNQGDGKFLLQHLVDWVVEEKSIVLTADDLPDGGFGFEYCCNRSFIVDNVVVETFTPGTPSDVLGKFHTELATQQKPLEQLRQTRSRLGNDRPGKIAWATDVSAKPPEIHLLERGNYAARGPVAEPAPFSSLSEPANSFEVRPPFEGAKSTGRRLAWANWVTRPNSRAAALLARVHVNRIWQHHFGTGLVATPDNLGVSSAPASHPELLNWLANELVLSGWNTKHVHRLILNSNGYKQSSLADAERLKRDPDCRFLSRFPVRRLDAETIRDSMLAVSGNLNPAQGGPYIATTRDANGEVLVPEGQPGAARRSIYLQQRRTQVLSMLQVFDAPSIVFNSTRRPRSTMPLQSLSLLNSQFAIARASSLAARLEHESPSEPERLELAYLMTATRPPTAEERAAMTEFLETQTATYQPDGKSRQKAWIDLCQMLLAGNSFLYVE